MPSTPAERDLVQRIRRGDEDAWRECIGEYEGRLLAYAHSRIRDRALAEDLVQETFLGFLTALPNYDEATPLESFLFAIAAHKVTDALRRQGRRPTLPLNAPDGSSPAPRLIGPDRHASSIARSRERLHAEQEVIGECLRGLIAQWFSRGEYERLKCAELLFVRGLANKAAAQVLGISEQDVANHKQFIVAKLKDAARRSPSGSLVLPSLESNLGD